jgi:hypothetical protein
MKAPEWDDGLFTAHRNYIEVEEVRRAFDYLSAAAFRTDLFSIQNSGVARQKKSFHYNEPLTAQRPFAFIVNRGHLLFYVRLPGQARFPGGIDFFKQSFAAVNDNPDGEWTIRIVTLEDAKRIQEIALGSESSEGSYTTIDLAREEADEITQRAIEQRRDIGAVEKEQLIRARRGQGQYRKGLESIEFGCRLTGVSDRRHLRASHIKPWCKSDDREKLDGNNGLLLSPHVDYLFDRGYISFTNNGDLMVSKRLEQAVLRAWGIELPTKTSPFSHAQCAYLEYHRQEVYLK